MGDDPDSSVVDPYGRAHDVRKPVRRRRQPDGHGRLGEPYRHHNRARAAGGQAHRGDRFAAGGPGGCEGPCRLTARSRSRRTEIAPRDR